MDDNIEQVDVYEKDVEPTTPIRNTEINDRPSSERRRKKKSSSRPGTGKSRKARREIEEEDLINDNPEETIRASPKNKKKRKTKSRLEMLEEAIDVEEQEYVPLIATPVEEAPVVEEPKKEEEKQIELVFCPPQRINSIELQVKQVLQLVTVSNQVPAVEGIISKLKRQKEQLQKIHARMLKISDNATADLCIQTIEIVEKKMADLKEMYGSTYRQVDKKAEGFFVPKKPYLLHNREHIIEQRFLRQDNGIERFFDEDGHLPQLMNPYKLVFTKPEENAFDSPQRTNPYSHDTTATPNYKMYYLEIEVKKIAFHDHPLMSEEEFHCKQIVGMCSLFLDTREKNLLGYYKERVVVRSFHFINFKALTTELEKLRELESKNVYSATDQRLKKMSNIRAELKKIRVEAESQEYRQLGLVANIASKWKLIKSIREKNHLTTCNVRIQFEKIEHDDDDNILEHDIKEELLEMEEEGLEFDIDAEYDKIRSRLLTCRRKPGAPELVPVISKCDLTKEEELSVQEKNRMKTIKSKEYLVELVINNVPVSSTTAQPLRCVDGSYFVVKVNEIIPCTVVKWPDSVSLNIWEKGTLKNRKIATVFVAIPGHHSDVKNSQKLHFTDMLPHVPLWDPEHPDNQPSSWFSWIKKSFANPAASHNCNGQVDVNINWIGDTPEPPTMKEFKPTARDLLSIQKVMKWMEGNRIDPNDPNNTGLLSAVDSIDDDIISSKGFHLAQQDDAMFFEGARDHTYQRRLHLLKLRYESKKVPIQVPLDEELITASFVKDYESKIADSFLSHDKLRSKYVQRVRSQLSKERQEQEQPQRLVKNNIKVSQYVSEPPIPQFSSSSSWLTTFLEPMRPLRPSRIDRLTTVTSMVTKCNIIVQVIRGYNIPLRTSDDNDAYTNYAKNRALFAEQEAMSKTMRRTETVPDETKEEEFYLRENIAVMEENEQEGEHVERVLSFVTVSFGNYSRKTKITEGPFPQFNQTLQFPFEPPNDDFSPQMLSLINQEIYFDIFDEVTIHNKKDERDIHVTNRRAEFRWLGSFSIPFEILYQNKQILGTFRVKTPPVRLGYVIDPSINTALAVCVTLDPPLPTEEEPEDMLSSGEPPELYMQANYFVQRLKKKNRMIMALAPNIDQKATLVCRYVRAQEPPPDLVKPSQVVRFVATIPFVSDSQTFGADDRWLTVHEFFETGAGDWEEHAILLCNYFKYLGKKAYVVLGRGVPEGQTCYVLTYEDDQVSLWNAATGVTYNVSDALCPLQEIGCIFDDTNIWANVQRQAQPSKMNFDLEYGGDWRPLYRKGDRTPMDKLISHKGKLESIQLAKIEYLPIEEAYLKNIETTLTIQIKKNFDEWRKEGVTLWNSHVGAKLYELLQKLEIAKQNDQEISMKDHQEILQDVVTSFVVVGFPLNYAYTDAKPIIDELYNTLVYANSERDVQFALAVYAHPYVNNVVSVWVYIVSLVSKARYLED